MVLLKPVGLSGLEPPTSRLSGVRSNRLSYKPICGSFLPSGDEEIRTLDPLLARQVLSQLSYIPSFKVVRLISFSEQPKKLNSSSLCSDSLTFLWSGSHLLSHTVSSAVPSAA